MSTPVSQAHPAEVVFTIVTLHVIATAVLLYANVALRAVLNNTFLFELQIEIS